LERKIREQCEVTEKLRDLESRAKRIAERAEG